MSSFIVGAAGGFKSAQQWKVMGSQGRKEIVVERNGERRFLLLAQAAKFTLFQAEPVALSVGDTIRITKNFRAGGTRFRNNELHTVAAVGGGKVVLEAGELGDRLVRLAERLDGHERLELLSAARSREECRRRYYKLNAPGREQEVEIER